MHTPATRAPDESSAMSQASSVVAVPAVGASAVTSAPASFQEQLVGKQTTIVWSAAQRQKSANAWFAPKRAGHEVRTS